LTDFAENVYNKESVESFARGSGVMTQAKRIVVSLPDSLLQEVDGIVRREQGNRSAFVREAMLLLIRERHRLMEMELEKWRSGYEKMAAINRKLAEEGLDHYLQELEKYEDYLEKRK
jgi:CopG family transcriptional regulator/antitoxin EndoAI